MVKEDTVMRKKGLMVLGLTVAMSLSLPLLSYAQGIYESQEENLMKETCPLKIFGQEIVEETNGGFPGGMRAIVIIAGADRIEDNDLELGNGIITKKELNTDNGKLPEFNEANKIDEFMGGSSLPGKADYIEVKDTTNNFLWDILVCRIPNSIRSVDELREFKKYVIYTNGYQSGTLDIGWQKNDEGYWYNCGNGVYPIKEWKEIDGKFYYFNYDGYMSFNMWTEDGYYVDENGAWIPGYDEELIDNAVIDYTRYYYDENGVIIKEEFSVPVSKASDINNLYNNFAENEYPKISRSAALTFNSKAHMQKLLDMMGEDHTMRPGF